LTGVGETRPYDISKNLVEQRPDHCAHCHHCLAGHSTEVRSRRHSDTGPGYYTPDTYTIKVKGKGKRGFV